MAEIIRRMRRIVDSACSDPTLTDTAKIVRQLLTKPETKGGHHIGFEQSPLAEIYRFRDKHLTSRNIDHGGFVETVDFFSKQGGEIEVLSCVASGCWVAVWLNPHKPEEIGIMYVKQVPRGTPVFRDELLEQSKKVGRS